MFVPYRGYSGSFPTLSATRLLQGDADEGTLDVLEGAVVLIGTSALGLADLRTTPFQTSFPGVEVQANAVDTILNAYWQQSNAPDDARRPFYVEPDWRGGGASARLGSSGGLLAVGGAGRGAGGGRVRSWAW